MHNVIDTNLVLRQAKPEDGDFLFKVYASTRSEEVTMLPWSEAEKLNFIKSQFQAQDTYYKQNYPGAEFQVILLDDQPAGRLYMHWREDEIRIMDIALLHEFRNQGIGTSLLNTILEEASENHLPVTIHVERFNPALSLYERLGFRLAEDKGVYLFMKWLPPILEKDEDTRTTAKQ